MRIRTPLAALQGYSLMGAGLLAFAASGCRQPAAPPSTPSLAPAASVPSPPSAQPAPSQLSPEAPSVAPSPASRPGRLKVAIYASGVWIDGQYLSPLASLDYLGLFRRLRERRAAAGDGVEARTLELEVDAASAGRNLQDVLELVEDADYERVELVTSTGPVILCTDRCSTTGPKPGSSNGRRTALLLRRDTMSLWSGKDVPADASGADPELEKLLEIPNSASDDEFDAGIRRVCSKPGRCGPIAVHFEEGLRGGELLRVLQRLDRAAPTRHPGLPVISLSSWPPPPAGDESLLFEFVAPSSSSGRLPVAVIRQIVRASYGVFRNCYERGLAMSPKLEGRVTVRFVIERDGSVGRVAHGGGDLPDDDVVSCVLHGFGGLQFPAPKGGVVEVQYPIVLLTRR